MGTLNKIANLLNWDKPAVSARRQWVDFNSPLFKSEFGTDIYASDIVKTAISRISTAVSKCILRSVIEKTAPRTVVAANDEINALFASKVNPFMTQKDFLQKVGFLTIANENCFIYPTYDEIPVAVGYVRRVYTGFYPLDKVTKGVIYHNGTEARIELSNDKGYSFDMPYADIIHIRHNFGQHPFLGGDSAGKFDARGLLKNLTVIQAIKDSVPKAIETSLSVKGVFTVKGLAEFDQRKVDRNEFESSIVDSKYGFFATDYATDFHEVNIQMPDLPENILTFIQQEILYPYGVSMPIMAGKYTDDDYSAFYQTAVEDVLTAIGQAFTATAFTGNQLTRGHRIKVYDRLVQNLSMERRIRIVELVKDNALLDADEQRELLGYEPNGSPTRVSLNFVDTNIINEYQLSGADKANPAPPAPAGTDKSDDAQAKNGGNAKNE